MKKRATTSGVAVVEEREVRVPKSKTVKLDMSMPVFEHGSVMLRHLECKLTPRQSRALRLLFDGLVAEGESIQLGGTTPEKVTAQHDAVRWVLDRIADEVEGPVAAAPAPAGRPARSDRPATS